jgi:hypothetical protein
MAQAATSSMGARRAKREEIPRDRAGVLTARANALMDDRLMGSHFDLVDLT